MTEFVIGFMIFATVFAIIVIGYVIIETHVSKKHQLEEMYASGVVMKTVHAQGGMAAQEQTKRPLTPTPPKKKINRVNLTIVMKD